MGLFDGLELEKLCEELTKQDMKGLNKFKKEIEAEVQKISHKDEKKKQLIQNQANEIIKHIESVCDEEYDNLLAQDHKSFRRMWTFVTNHAKEYAIDNCAMVPDSVVYGWIDEYVGLDDKEAVEKEKKAAEKKPAKTSTFDVKKEIEKAQAKIKEEKKWEQVSIFDLI